MSVTNLSAFLAANAKRIENKRVVISDRFLDEAGNPIPWEIRALSAEEHNSIRDECQIMAPAPGKAGKRGAMLPKTDMKKYRARMIEASVVFPDLSDAELQNSYGVMGANNLINVMLTAGEYENLFEAISEISGFDAETAIEEAKN